MGDASDGVSATDGRDRGEVGLSDSGRGVREKRERDRHRWGADMHAREAQSGHSAGRRSSNQI
jgi:hypothetical protein